MSIRDTDESSPFVPRVRRDSRRVKIYPSCASLQGDFIAETAPNQGDSDIRLARILDLPFRGECDRTLQSWSDHVAHLTNYAHQHRRPRTPCT